MNALEFDRDMFMEQGFRFTLLSERVWAVEALESWTSYGETWVSIGRVMESKIDKSYHRWQDLSRWASISAGFIQIGHRRRLDAAQHLEKLYYGK
jgi:hypothetical protein